MIEPIAFYRSDWEGNIVFGKNNTATIRKNKNDFSKGLIRSLYSEENVNELTHELEVAINQIEIMGKMLKGSGDHPHLPGSI